MFQRSCGGGGGPILTVHMQAIELAIFKGVQTPPPPRHAHVAYALHVQCLRKDGRYLLASRKGVVRGGPTLATF